MTLKPVISDTPSGADGSGDVSPWEDPNFHTKSREESVSISLRIPHSSMRGVAKIVQSGKYAGLETASDAYRDAIWRWLRWMAVRNDDQSAAMDLDIQRAQWKLEAELSRHQSLINTVDTAEKILEDGNHSESTRRRVLTELSSLALKIEDSHLRKRIIKLVAKHR